MDIKRWILTVAGCFLLAGCSIASTGTGETPTGSEVAPVISTPSSGRSLSNLGFTNGAAPLVWLPTGIQVTYTADQPNLLIVTGVAAQAAQVEAYLRQTLPGLGWHITAEADGGLMFDQAEWHGAYVLGEDTWALTVRND